MVSKLTRTIIIRQVEIRAIAVVKQRNLVSGVTTGVIIDPTVKLYETIASDLAVLKIYKV